MKPSDDFALYSFLGTILFYSSLIFIGLISTVLLFLELLHPWADAVILDILLYFFIFAGYSFIVYLFIVFLIKYVRFHRYKSLDNYLLDKNTRVELYYSQIVKTKNGGELSVKELQDTIFDAQLEINKNNETIKKLNISKKSLCKKLSIYKNKTITVLLSILTLGIYYLAIKKKRVKIIFRISAIDSKIVSLEKQITAKREIIVNTQQALLKNTKHL